MKNLWILLLLLLCPGIEGDKGTSPEDEEAPPEDEEAPPEDEEAPPEDEEAPPEDEEAPAPKETRGQKQFRELRERAQTAETQRAAAEAALAEARRSGGNQQQAAPSNEQLLWQQEETALRNPEINEWQRYAIQSAREARKANLNANAAVREARDLADRTRFEQLKATKPKMFENYAPKVEAMLKEMRANGNDAPRDDLLALLVGRDVRDGKLEPTNKPAKPNGGVDRGKTPGARANVQGGTGRMTEAEKREKRLENVRI